MTPARLDSTTLAGEAYQTAYKQMSRHYLLYGELPARAELDRHAAHLAELARLDALNLSIFGTTE